MYSLYHIINTKSQTYYIGKTKNTLTRRMVSHRCSANRGKKSPLYDAMRRYGIDKFIIVLVCAFECNEECCEAEIKAIADARNNGDKIYNLSCGGDGGFVITNPIQKEQWREKLKKARQGRKPALGIIHSEENIRLFSEVSKKYWDTQNTYPIEDIISLSHLEAKKKYGISTTHYYRLRNRHKTDEE